MDAIKTFKLAGAVLIAVASAIPATSTTAWAQDSDAAATSTPAQGTSKSAVRKANRALSRKVVSALSKGGVNTEGINVLVKGGAVTLAGSATDPGDIEKAGSIAKGVSGVTSVKNALTIREGGQ
jgi:hyperosmotically inducible periplasmic protein